MRAIELVAWGEALGVTSKEVPWALRARARRLEDIHNDLVRERVLLSDAPEEKLVVLIAAVDRVMAAAASHLVTDVRDAHRPSGCRSGLGC